MKSYFRLYNPYKKSTTTDTFFSTADIAETNKIFITKTTDI